MFSQEAISSRIGKIIRYCEKNEKISKNGFAKELDTLYDIQNLKEEYKKLHHKLKESQGKVG